MSAAEAAPEAKPSRSGRLLALVRALIAFGRQAARTLRTSHPTLSANDIALILRRIARGLLRAEALEARIIRGAPWLDAEPRPHRAPGHRASPAQARGQPTPRPANMTDLIIAAMPSAEEIAAEVRRRPIGAVIADICRDIGIMPCDQLWPEIFDLIIRYNGNLVPLVSDGVRRAFRHNPAVAWPNSPLPVSALSPTAPSGAGPPG